VQVSPVDTDALPHAWITGSFKLKNFEVQFPVGIANLTFHDMALANEGHPWSQLRRLLGTQPISLPTGDWYRARCAMDLSIDDGLDW
jgi:hypothetical protein